MLDTPAVVVAAGAPPRTQPSTDPAPFWDRPPRLLSMPLHVADLDAFYSTESRRDGAWRGTQTC